MRTADCICTENKAHQAYSVSSSKTPDTIPIKQFIVFDGVYMFTLLKAIFLMTFKGQGIRVKLQPT